tara:strand:+ start:2005 stop:2874 length:870 start_codon:yes stop_codon:yes gene_type:complete
MCEPISAGSAMALGAAQAGVQGLGAINSFNNKRAQSASANKAIRDRYLIDENLRRERYRNQLSVYNRQLVEYDLGESAAQDALARGYVQNQKRLNEVYDAAAFSTQAGAIAERQATGRALASGQSGRSVQLNMQNAMSQYGRNQAILAANLLGANERFNYDVDSLRRQYISNRNQAFSNVATPPQPGLETPKPDFVQGPSALGLVADLGQAAINGFSTYSDLKAPNVFKNTQNITLDQIPGGIIQGAGAAMGAGLAESLPYITPSERTPTTPTTPAGQPVRLDVIPYQP